MWDLWQAIQSLHNSAVKKTAWMSFSTDMIFKVEIAATSIIHSDMRTELNSITSVTTLMLLSMNTGGPTLQTLDPQKRFDKTTHCCI